MALRKQSLALQFAGGIETKQDPKQVPATKLLDLQNCTFIRQTTLAKRNGYQALGRVVDGMGGTYGNPRGLAERDDELLIFDDQQCYSYRNSSDTWAPAGKVGVASAKSTAIARTGTHQTQPDIASNGGVAACVWEDSRGGVWCSVLEDETGRILLTQQLDAAGALPRCVAVGTVLHILWVNATTIRLAVVNPATPELALVSSILTADLDPLNPVYDAEPTTQTADNPAALAWSTPGGYRVGYLVAPGVLGTPLYGVPSIATALTGAVPSGIAVSWSAAFLVVLRVLAGPSVKAAAHTASNPAIVTDTALTATATSACPRVTGAQVNGVYWWSVEVPIDNRTDHQAVLRGSLTLAGFVVGNINNTRGHGLASRAFVDDLDVYTNITHGARFYPYVATVRVSGGNACVARLLPGLSSGMLLRNHLPSVQSTNRVHSFPLGYRIQLASSGGDQFGEQGIRRHLLDLGSAPYSSAQLGRGLYLASAVPLHYDGSRWAEADFHAAPDYGYTYVLAGAPALATLTAVTGLSQLSQAGGGGLTALNDYGYKVWYEEVDAQGELHPGAVGVQIDIVLTGANDQVTLTIPTYRLTSKNRVRISIARSVGNDDSQFFRLTSLDPTSAQYLLNDPTVDTLTFVDGLADAALKLREPLYTNGGILSNDPVPIAGGVVAGAKSRLFFLHPDDPNLVCYSQQLRDDTAVEMSAALTVRLDPYGGGVVALSAMDDAVYCFKLGSIYGFAGPGPDADGGATSQNAWSPPVLVTSDVGCTDPGSICQSPMGIVFKSAKGFKLLGRDQQVQDIGAPVYGFNAQAVTRATLLPDRHQIVFLTDIGLTLLWDYEHNQWSTFTNHDGLDAVVIEGVYHYLRVDGRVFMETIGEYKDDNSHIPMVIETAWIKAAGYLQGWQRVWHALFIGQYMSEHTLRVRTRIDYQDGYSAPIDIDVDANYNPELYGAGLYGAGDYGGAGGPTTVYQQRVHLNKRCQSISFRLEDIEATNSFGASFELSELLLTIGVLGPAFQPGARRSN